MAQHNELGKKGEELACSELIRKGYQILDRNWRFGRDEIDIIARIGNDLVIVEVKARNSDFFGDPAEFVSRGKQKTLIRAANAYVLERDLDVEVRFDVIGLVINKAGIKLEHIEAAFHPTW